LSYFPFSLNSVVKKTLLADGRSLCIYRIADYLKLPVFVIRQMTEEEFIGWLAYFEIRKSEEKEG
jgi:hypothetical protein